MALSYSAVKSSHKEAVEIKTGTAGHRLMFSRADCGRSDPPQNVV